MIREAFDSFKTWADLLAKEEGVVYSTKGREVIEQMMNAYCLAKDIDDEHRKNLYIAGLMLRFWYVIPKLKERSPIQGLETVDYMMWLYEAIEYACKYRIWQKPSSRVNAQQAINQCIETIRVQKYYDLNLQKNKANVNTYSLETPLEADGKTTIADTLVDEDALEKKHIEEGAEAAYDLIQKCINKKKIVEAIILDTIAFNDVQKVNKTVIKGVDENGKPFKRTQHTREFWPFRCVQLLSNLPEDYAEYFHKHYAVIDSELEAALASIRKASNQKLYKFLDRTLSDTRKMVSYA